MTPDCTYSQRLSALFQYSSWLVGLMGVHQNLARLVRDIFFCFNFEDKPIRALSVVLALMIVVFSIAVFLISTVLQLISAS
jgi:hypothetical protein